MKHFTKKILVGYFFCTPSIFYIDPQEVLDLLSNQSPKQEGFRKNLKPRVFMYCVWTYMYNILCRIKKSSNCCTDTIS